MPMGAGGSSRFLRMCLRMILTKVDLISPVGIFATKFSAALSRITKLQLKCSSSFADENSCGIFLILSQLSEDKISFTVWLIVRDGSNCIHPITSAASAPSSI